MDLHAAVALSTLTGLTRGRAFAVYKELIEQAGSTSLEEVIACAAPGANVERIADAARAQATALLDAAAASGIVAVRSVDEGYPPLLRTIADPPPVLWGRGDLASLTRPGVAIVGSRAATSYALEVAARLAGELAGRGVLVVSGLARGADGAAHRGCLAAGGATVAVLGSGPDVIYPPEHRELSVSICCGGALVSEHGPGVPPLPDHFPLRNRLISGISLGVVVVEANEKSGSLITARYALEQGRDVMAVPGSVLGGRNRGSHALLKDGAKVVETADDILEELGWSQPSSGSARTAPETGDRPGPGGRGSRLDEKISSKSLRDEDLLQNLTPGESYDVDEMSATVGLAGGALLPRLTQWEMQGRVVKLPGGRYVRRDGRG
ncbi:MAG TPA: DNA-processing protein DprA [Vicinamibacterales bacterium]|nr:DNA-processing protein DprA [Vicinamibacterales bacterium]